MFHLVFATYHIPNQPIVWFSSSFSLTIHNQWSWPLSFCSLSKIMKTKLSWLKRLLARPIVFSILECLLCFFDHVSHKLIHLNIETIALTHLYSCRLWGQTMKSSFNTTQLGISKSPILVRNHQTTIIWINHYNIERICFQ